MLAFLLEGGTGNFHGYSFDPARVTSIPIDGRPHPVPDLTTEKGIVWTSDTTYGWPTCRYHDVALDRTDRIQPYFEGAGDYGSHSALGSFPVGSGHVTLTCKDASTPGGHTGMVMIGPDPQLGHRVGRAILSIILAGMLGLVGIVGLIGMALLWVSHAPRRPRRSGPPW